MPCSETMDFIRPKRASVGIDMAPLIDVVFQLLIFFMLTSSFMNPALKLLLPTASSREKIDPDQLMVSVDQDGQIFVGTEKVEMTKLKAVLEARLSRMGRKQVNFRGDQNLRYQQFVSVMDIAKLAGARQFNIVHQPPQP